MKVVYSKVSSISARVYNQIGIPFIEVRYNSAKKSTGSIIVLKNGELVKEELRGFRLGNNVIRVNCSGLEAGNYMLVLMTSENIFQKEVVIL